jgi:hypothetical protein
MGEFGLPVFGLMVFGLIGPSKKYYIVISVG